MTPNSPITPSAIAALETPKMYFSTDCWKVSSFNAILLFFDEGRKRLVATRPESIFGHNFDETINNDSEPLILPPIKPLALRRLNSFFASWSLAVKWWSQPLLVAKETERYFSTDLVGIEKSSIDQVDGTCDFPVFKGTTHDFPLGPVERVKCHFFA